MPPNDPSAYFNQPAQVPAPTPLDTVFGTGPQSYLGNPVMQALAALLSGATGPGASPATPTAAAGPATPTSAASPAQGQSPGGPEAAAGLPPEVTSFLAGLTPDDLGFLEQVIQTNRDPKRREGFLGRLRYGTGPDQGGAGGPGQR